MASLFEIGKSGVQAYRQALSVTGQNIANINTEGYNKRAAEVTEIAGASGGATNVADQSGLGVRVENIRRSFDAYLSDKTRTTTSDHEKLNDFVSKLSDLENMLLPSNSDLGTFIGRFFDSLQDVSSNPDSVSARIVSVEAGKALASSFNSYDKQLNDFKSGSIKQNNVQIKEANLYIDQLVKVNSLILRSGTGNASNDILDARDQLLIKLSKIINFTVDYDQTGAANVRIGDSGNGTYLVEKNKGSTLTSSSDEKNINIMINKDGLKISGNNVSSGILSGINQFYSLVDSIKNEIGDLAEKMAKDINGIQVSGIDLNGKTGKSMFSINSMSPIANDNNKSSLTFSVIEGDPNKIKQERVIIKYSQSQNNWEVSNSSGISYSYGNKINLDGLEIEIHGKPQDGDGFIISPSSTKSGAIKFNLKNPEDIAAASKNLISKSSDNLGNVNLSLLGAVETEEINFPSKIQDIFSSSTNPLLATSFIKDGSVATIPTTTNEINLSSLGNQSSAIFTIADAQIKGFSSFNITLANANTINLKSSSTDPGDGIKSVKELADLLNSGLMLDGKSQHDFKKYGLYASGSNGYLTIASSLSDISASSIFSRGNSFSPSISNIPASSALASNIQIFTRDGRHVSGTTLNSSEIASILKTKNGFLKSAEYRNDYLNNNYRGMSLTRQTASGDFANSFGSSISYNEQSTDMDALLTSQTLSGGSGTITLDGSKEFSSDLDSYITFKSAKDESSRTFTLNGYDLDGLYQTETITGGNITTVKSSKVYSEVLSVSVDGNSLGNITIGTEAIGYSLKVKNNDDITSTSTVPVGASANYLASKLKTDLAGTGVHVSANTKVILGPFDTGVSGTVSFKLKGKNTDSVSINTTISAKDISALANQINQYTSQTGLTAIATSDFKKIIIDSKDGYDINLTEIKSPSDFYLETLNDDFIPLDDKLLIDVSNTKKISAHIKGQLKFVSSEIFSTQIDSGVVNSAATNSFVNGYITLDKSISGEKIVVKPEVFHDLDNNVGSLDGKKALVGISKYGLDINQKNYEININDDDSIYASNNPGSAGTITLDGTLRNANDLNAIVSIYCSASETGNTFTITGEDQNGSTITEAITGVSSSNTAIGSTTFTKISSITSSATASGNIKIGTIGFNDINDEDSLVEKTTFSSGVITMDGVLTTSDYLGAKIQITSEQDTTGTSFVVAGIDMNGAVLSETIVGSNGGKVTTTGIFQTISSINNSGTSNGKIKIGTVGADGNWSASIDANALNIDSEEEISSAIGSSLRIGTTNSQIKGIVLNALPSNGQSVDLSFEDQVFKLKMVGGEILIDGPENNRVKARFNGTSENINNSISILQGGVASTALTINGLNSVTSDTDGLVDAETLGSSGNFTIDGALSSIASSDLSSVITVSSANNNSSVTFTITGTDVDGNAQTETITGVNANSVEGTKFFKTVTQISSDAAASAINVGTKPAFGSISGTRVSITAVGNETNNLFTIVGTGTDGLSKTETIYGPSTGKTISSNGLYDTITSIKPSINTVGNIQIGTSPGYELLATVEGTIEGAQFKIVQDSVNVTNASNFGISKGITTLKGNFVPKPSNLDEAIKISVNDGSTQTDFTIKFNSSGEPKFYNSKGSALSGSPPSDITLAWNDLSGVTDDDALFNGNMSAGVGITTSGVLSSTDDDSLFTSKSSTAGDLILDGNLKYSKALNGIATIYCNGDETSNSFAISGYDNAGVYQIDTITGLNGATASGNISFSEILSVSASNATASTIKVGTQATSVTFDPSSITVTPAGSDVGEKYTVTGLDQFGKAQIEVITAGGSGVTVYGKKVFSQVSSFIPTSGSASTVKVGTQRVGSLSISHAVNASTFELDSNPNAAVEYGMKTQNIRLNVDSNGLNIINLKGAPLKIEVPQSSIENSVAEKVSIKNLPPEDFITIVMGNGARKISAEFDVKPSNDNIKGILAPELTIKVDATNSNKVEIFDKISGHSIASRILDANRVFEVNGSKFQFSEDPLINNTFGFSNNTDGIGDNRNIINILNLQSTNQTGDKQGNFQEIFINTVARVGSNVQANKLSLSSALSTLNAAEASQSEFAGVNLDEEAAHLLEFQQAYQASARILQTAKELFQSLIEVV